MNLPDLIETGPPGRTVHVVAARAVRTAAGNASRLRARRLLTGPRLRPAWKEASEKSVR